MDDCYAMHHQHQSQKLTSKLKNPILYQSQVGYFNVPYQVNPYPPFRKVLKYPSVHQNLHRKYFAIPQTRKKRRLEKIRFLKIRIPTQKE